MGHFLRRFARASVLQKQDSNPEKGIHRMDKRSQLALLLLLNSQISILNKQVYGSNI